MSKDTLTEKDKKLANLFVDMYKNVDKHTKEIANLEEQLYKQYQAMAIDKQIKLIEDTYNTYVKEEDN